MRRKKKIYIQCNIYRTPPYNRKWNGKLCVICLQGKPNCLHTYIQYTCIICHVLRIPIHTRCNNFFFFFFELFSPQFARENVKMDFFGTIFVVLTFELFGGYIFDRFAPSDAKWGLIICSNMVATCHVFVHFNWNTFMGVAHACDGREARKLASTNEIFDQYKRIGFIYSQV